MNKNTQLIALNRFGYGPSSPGDIKHVQRVGAKRWVLRQLKAQQTYQGLGSDGVYQLMASKGAKNVKPTQGMSKEAYRKQRREMRKAERKNKAKQSNLLFRRAQIDLHKNAVSNSSSVRSHAVSFWSNHFSVSKRSIFTRSMVGAFVKEAIAPHVSGNFSTMLRGAITHATMLHYLDNVKSVGPNSKFGKRRKKNLNENLAREVLELHTLGVGNYSQQDIIALANILTGWTASYNTAGKAKFNRALHEPGDFTVLGKTYSGTRPEQQLLSVLDDLAKHPKTAEHLSRKLCQHMLGQHATAANVHAVSRAYLRSQGSLYAMYDALLDIDSVWKSPVVRYRQPDEWLYAMARAIPNFDDFKWINGKLNNLGKEPFTAVSPAGWPDVDVSWRTPEFLFRQKLVAQDAARRFAKQYDIKHILDLLFDGQVDDHLKQALNLSNDKQQQFMLIFLSPSMLYR